jgi:hypothetical protein
MSTDGIETSRSGRICGDDRFIQGIGHRRHRHLPG